MEEFSEKMWKSRSYLDRNYSTLQPPATNDLRYELQGEVDPLSGTYTEFPYLEDEIEDADPKHVFLLVFFVACFIVATSVVIAFVVVARPQRYFE